MRRTWRLAMALVALTPGVGWSGTSLSPQASRQIQRAQAAMAGGDARGAEFHLQQALEAGAERRAVAVAMGQALAAQGQFAEARGWLVGGGFASGQELAGWRELARVEQSLGNLAAAGAAFDQALKIAPRDSGLWVEIGRLRYRGGEQWEALAAADFALKLDPDNPTALGFRAQLERDRSGHGAALELYERAVSLAPSDVALRYDYAATLGELGQTTTMLEVLEQGRPDDPGALFLKAVMAARAGDYRLARALSAKAGRRWPDSAAVLELRAILELEAGNPNEAVSLLDILIARQPVNYQVRLLLARALYDSGQHEALLERFSSVAERDDAPVYLLTLMGRAQEDRGDRLAAAKWLDRAAIQGRSLVEPLPFPGEAAQWPGRWESSPGSVAVAIPYVRSLLAAGNLAKAEQIAEAARQGHFGSADAQWLAGDVQLAFDRREAALDRYVAAAQIRYSDLLVLRMAQALEQQGRREEAGAATARYLAAYPGNHLAARLAAGQRAVAGDWQGSRVLLESLVRRGGGRDARLLSDLSLAQLRDGDSARALETGRRAWQLQPASPVTAQAYAMALVARKQDLPLARQLLDQAKVIGGNNPLLAETSAKLATR